LETNPPWLNVSPSNGLLAPLSATNLNCSLNAAAALLPPGDYSGNVVLTNLTFGASEAVPFLFLVGLVQNGGFETGDFTGWTLDGDLSYTSIVTNDPDFVHSGDYGANLSTSTGPCSLSQTIPTTPGLSYLLSLWLDVPDDGFPNIPNFFMVTWGGAALCDLTNLPPIGWTNLLFTVSASQTNTVLQIGFRNDPNYFGLDDVSLTVIVAVPQIMWTNPANIVYGGVLGGGQLDAAASVPGTFTYDPPAGAVLDAGTNLLNAVFTPSNNLDYSSVTDSVSLVVTPAPLSVTASNATRAYGVTNPLFTGSITGLQNGDLIGATYSCGATSASPAAAYPIVPTLVDPNNRLPNYQVSVLDGTLTVLAPVPPSIQSVWQSGDTLVFSWTATTGNAYQVQWNSDLTGTNWTDLGDGITATNSTITTTDTLNAAQCFYRVVLVPQ
jgi:hypothetical protein